MDIFSATGKQVEAATAPKVAHTEQVRQVETPTQATKSAREEKPKEEDLHSMVSELNKQMEALDTNVSFGYNDKISTMFVNVMEKSTGKSIRKIPTEEAMELSAKMKEIIGMIFDKKG